MNTRNTPFRSAFVIVALLTVGAVLAPTALGSVWWNSSSNPLIVSGYDSTGRGYGNLDITTGGSGTLYSTKTYQRIMNADNHQVYARLTYFSNSGICFAPSFAQCTSQYYIHASDETEHTSNASYVRDTRALRLMVTPVTTV